LVRSNKEGKIGFLKEFERVNVMFSRARHGMIIVGNHESVLRTE
jgi:superfamily I DNA and/or RNA helicase